MGLERFTKKGVALRKSPRERKEHVVRLELEGGAPSLSGVLSDLSATGARISLAAPYAMPAKFALVFGAELFVWFAEFGVGPFGEDKTGFAMEPVGGPIGCDVTTMAPD